MSFNIIIYMKPISKGNGMNKPRQWINTNWNLKEIKNIKTKNAFKKKSSEEFVST